MGTIVSVRIVRFENGYGSRMDCPQTEQERREVYLQKRREQGREFRERHKVRGRK